jgi:hypothetical protein
VSVARKLLIVSGLLLTTWGLCWGLSYAVFVEHQILDSLGAQVTTAFVHAAERDLPQAHALLQAYANSEFHYVRQVDVHSHWTGLAMLLVVLGAAFERVRFSDSVRMKLAVVLVIGSAVFPLGVILQNLMAGLLPSVLAVSGAALVIFGLSATAWGFARPPAKPVSAESRPDAR